MHYILRIAQRACTLAFAAIFFVNFAERTEEATITFLFEGVVTGQASAIPSVSLGDPIVGSFSYNDAATMPATGSGLGVASRTYFRPDAEVLINYSVGSFNANSVIGINSFTVTNESGGGDFREAFRIFSTMSGNTVNGFTPSEVFLEFEDFPLGDALGASLLPPTTLALADFDRASIFFSFTNFPGNLIGDVTSLTQVSAVPLPAALPLFAGGLGLLGFIGWRRKRGASA